MRTRALMLIAVAMGAIVAVAPSASAGSTIVKGIQSVNVGSDSCVEPSADYTMTGGLVGCWWIDTITPDPEDPASYTPSGNGMFSGTEHFTGCIDADRSGSCGGSDPTGTFYTTFTFTAKFGASGEIHGRCHHPIYQDEDHTATGDFASATGVVNFTDDVTTDPVSATYVGPIRL